MPAPGVQVGVGATATAAPTAPTAPTAGVPQVAGGQGRVSCLKKGGGRAVSRGRGAGGRGGGGGGQGGAMENSAEFDKLTDYAGEYSCPWRTVFTFVV
jgi:hypothetical protein